MTVAPRGARGMDAPARFRAGDLLAMHRHAAPCALPIARARARQFLRVTAAHRAVTRHRARTARVPIEHLAVDGMAFPGCRGFGARGASRFLADTRNAALAWRRGNARRVFAGRADQRLRLHSQFALTRLRGARRVLECKAAIRIDASVDRSRAGTESQQQQRRANQPRETRASAGPCAHAVAVQVDTRIHGFPLRLPEVMVDHVPMPCHRMVSSGRVGKCRWPGPERWRMSWRSAGESGLGAAIPFGLTHPRRRSITQYENSR